MKASQWLKGATLVRHGNPLAKRNIVAIALAAALVSPIQAEAKDIDASNGYDQIGAHSQLLTDWARAAGQNVLVISAEDASAPEVVSSLSAEFLANADHNRSAHTHNADFSSLGNLRIAKSILNNEMGAMAGRIDRESGRVCIINGKTTYTTEGLNNESLVIGDSKQEQAWMMMHELSHCMSDISADHPLFSEMSSDAEKIAAKDLYEESLADVAAALYVASHTGNWNFATNGLFAHRIAEPQDAIHNSLPMLDTLIRERDPRSLAPMTPPQAMEQAMDFLGALNPNTMLARAHILSGAQMAYARSLQEVTDGALPVPELYQRLAGHRFKTLAGYGLYQEDPNRIDGLVALTRAVESHLERFQDPKAQALQQALYTGNAQKVLNAFRTQYGADFSMHTQQAEIDAKKVESALTQLGLNEPRNPFSATRGNLAPATPTQDGPQP